MGKARKARKAGKEGKEGKAASSLRSSLGSSPGDEQQPREDWRALGTKPAMLQKPG